MRVCYSYFYTICYFFRIFVCHAAPPPPAPRQPPSTPQSLPFLYELLAHKTDAKFLWRQPMHNHTHTLKLTYTYICSKLIPTQLWLLFLQLLLPLLLLLLQLLLLVVCHVCDSFHSSIFEAFFFRKKYQKIINAFVCVRWCVFVQFVSFAQLLASPTCAALLCSACNKSFAFVHIGNLLA